MALPAGIMVPVVPVTDFRYDAIDPEELEMPPLVPPSQRLLAAKDAFYKGLNMDAVVVQGDGISDDWDITNYPTEYLERKANLKKLWMEKLHDDRKKLEDEIRNKPSRKDEEMMKKEKDRKDEEMIETIKKKVDEYYAETDAQIDEEYEKMKERTSRSSSREGRRRSRSRSRSSRSSESSRSSRSSSSSSNSSEESRSRSRSRRRGRRSTTPLQRFQRSPSPEYTTPSFRSTGMTSGASNQPLSYDNKGAQLMAKMGWSSGKGLGASETGIVNPVDGGEVRDKMDKFRGIGSSLDPYEQFRKQRAGNYHERGSMFRK